MLAEQGILEKYNVKVIGVEPDAIKRGEDRLAFKQTHRRSLASICQKQDYESVDEAEAIAAELGYPVVIRPCLYHGRHQGAAWSITWKNCALLSAGQSLASMIGQILGGRIRRRLGRTGTGSHPRP